MQSLTQLANLYGSDKGTEGPSPSWPPHNYTDVYEAYLGALREEPVRLLEIGMGVPGEAWRADIARGRNAGGGASIKMWHDYFQKGLIYGLDVNPAPHLDNDRITTAVADQGDAQQLRQFAEGVGEPFDVIVDDGSHRPDHQQISLTALWSFLKPGGYYFVEDLMRNGRGDPDHGRFSSHEVLNTRRVLRQYLVDGTFATPNALGDAVGLTSEIDVIRFHVPVLHHKLRLKLAKRPRNAMRRVPVYRPESELLVMLRKRS